MLPPADRIWLIEQDFVRSDGIEHAEIVIYDEFLISEVGDGWRVTEYMRVRKENADS